MDTPFVSDYDDPPMTPFGIHLRDQFACAALTVMAGYQSIPDLVAQKSYEFADAMMKAREVQP